MSFCPFKFLLSWRVPPQKKTAFLDDCPFCLQGPAPSKAQILFLLSSRSRSLRASSSHALLLLDSRKKKDKEVSTPSFKIRRLGLRPLENPLLSRAKLPHNLTFNLFLSWETDFLPLLVLTCWGAAPVKASAGINFPRKYQRIPRNYYQHWC